MTVIIKNSSGIPIYEQIKEQIKETILNDEMNEDNMLPSIRQLAADLKVSVITTTRAYTELEQEGHIFNVQGELLCRPKRQRLDPRATYTQN